MAGAHAAGANRVHRHRKDERIMSRIANNAADIGRGALLAMTAAAVIATPASSNVSHENSRPGVEIITPGGIKPFLGRIARLGMTAKAQAMEQDLRTIRSYGLGRALRVITNIGQDQSAHNYARNIITTSPPTGSVDPKQTVSYYPELDGGIVEVDANVSEHNPVSGTTHTVDESQEFFVSGRANASLETTMRNKPLQTADYIAALHLSGVSMVTETVTIPPQNTATQTIIFSNGKVFIKGMSDAGAPVTPDDAGNLLPPFNGAVMAQAQLQQQDTNTYEQQLAANQQTIIV